jgi:hypothetical protein
MLAPAVRAEVAQSCFNQAVSFFDCASLNRLAFDFAVNLLVNEKC